MRVMSNKNKKIKISVISAHHFAKLIFRSLLLLFSTAVYIINRLGATGETFGGMEDNALGVGAIWLVFFVEILLRFFPSRTESMGAEKQFKRNYLPTGESVCVNQSGWRTFFALISWLALNGIFGALYLSGIFDAGIMVLISLAYAVCDMICILFFCPFQTWIMKNKCCNTCRIYNWDYAMMATPLVFVKNPFAVSMVVCSLLLVLRWEISYRLFPERFSEATNCNLHCSHCKEKLCQHKSQLRSFLRKNGNRLRLRGNAFVTGVKSTAEKIRKNK